ncbi:3'-5' exonuclease [Rothia sp. P5766]|uniref:3'-5' exonuclease n=1 Tax=Rothia sp. P5766 TaxID=3402656 RepID=UPI003AEDB920
MKPAPLLQREQVFYYLKAVSYRGVRVNNRIFLTMTQQPYTPEQVLVAFKKGFKSTRLKAMAQEIAGLANKQAELLQHIAHLESIIESYGGKEALDLSRYVFDARRELENIKLEGQRAEIEAQERVSQITEAAMHAVHKERASLRKEKKTEAVSNTQAKLQTAPAETRTHTPAPANTARKDENPRPSPLAEPAQKTLNTYATGKELSEDSDGWFMPKYKGRNICDWVDDINAHKRDGHLTQALSLANGCMEAMVNASRQNPVNVMEFYVLQVATIQHKQKDYQSEVETIEGWLALNFPPPREDKRIQLQKRLARAQELLAKQRGEDPSIHRARWKHYLELEKEHQKATKGQKSKAPSSGKSAVSPQVPYASQGRQSASRGRRSSWVAPSEILSSPSFVAVDFETANQHGASACQIALVKYSSGKIVEKVSSLIKPPTGLDQFEYTHIHKISARNVKRAPTWQDIATWVQEFCDGLPVYAHNASFDADVWRALDDFYGTDTLPARFFCSYRTAEKLVPGLQNYKLPTVTQALVPGFNLRHHDADSDAEACALIIAALASQA